MATVLQELVDRVHMAAVVVSRVDLAFLVLVWVVALCYMVVDHRELAAHQLVLVRTQPVVATDSSVAD